MYVKRVAGAAFAAALGMSGLTVGAGLANATPLKTDPACTHCGRVLRVPAWPIADDPPGPGPGLAPVAGWAWSWWAWSRRPGPGGPGPGGPGGPGLVARGTGWPAPGGPGGPGLGLVGRWAGWSRTSVPVDLVAPVGRADLVGLVDLGLGPVDLVWSWWTRWAWRSRARRSWWPDSWRTWWSRWARTPWTWRPGGPGAPRWAWRPRWSRRTRPVDLAPWGPVDPVDRDRARGPVDRHRLHTHHGVIRPG